MTLYRLSPETRSPMLCTSAARVEFWPPLTVRSLHTHRKGPGITGKLAVFRRPDGTCQVTPHGMPFYRFAGDGSDGQANGGGIQSFGGTWQ
jgi:predicted lipoprotein with Yx(FWY)xxD motif